MGKRFGEHCDHFGMRKLSGMGKESEFFYG